MYLVSYGEGFVGEWQQHGQMCKHAFEIIKIIQVIPKKKPTCIYFVNNLL